MNNLDIEELDQSVPVGAIAGDGRYEGVPGLYYKEVIEDLIFITEQGMRFVWELD